MQIASRIQAGILPSTLGLFDVVTEEVEGVPIVKVLVSGGIEKPYYIKSKGMSPSGCFVRVGTQCRMMTVQMTDNLYERRIHTTLRNILSPRQDLTFAQLRIYYQAAGLNLNDNFAKTLELLTPDGSYNYLAYLLADENGVSIKVARYAGADKVDLIKNEEFGYCSLVKTAHSVLDKLDVYNETSVKITYPVRLERKLVETTPMREAVINAIIHTDYTREVPPVFELFSDRLEVTSCGGLLPGLSKEDFFNCCSMPRNRELMRVFKDLGLVEQLGSGMSRILKSYGRDIFRISDNFVKVVFPYSEPVGLDGPNDGTDDDGRSKLEQVLSTLTENPHILIREICQSTGISERHVKRILKELKEQKRIIRIGSNVNGYWKTKE